MSQISSKNFTQERVTIFTYYQKANLNSCQQFVLDFVKKSIPTFPLCRTSVLSLDPTIRTPKYKHRGQIALELLSVAVRKGIRTLCRSPFPEEHFPKPISLKAILPNGHLIRALYELVSS